MIRTNDPISLPFMAVDALTGAGFDFSALAGDVCIFDIPFKCQVIRCQVAVATTFNGGIFNFDRRITAGTDTGRIAAGVAAFDITAMVAAPAQGQVVYFEPDAEVILYPGEQVVVDLATPATAGAGIPQLLVAELPETPANIAAMIPVS